MSVYLNPLPPASLRTLVDFLTASPYVRFTNFDLATQDKKFLREDAGGLWFVCDDGTHSYLPIDCRRTEAAAAAEAGVTFDMGGFTLTKVGHSIRVEYRICEENRA
jgi:hypothetical protein